MNLCVNSPFLHDISSPSEDSAEAHTADYIFKYVDKYIENTWPEKAV